jgi:urea carboxylase
LGLKTVNQGMDKSGTIEVLQSGMQTSVQDFPGRVGYWAVGVPPSGPMDSLSFRLANRLLKNPPDAAGLEITLTGPTLRFNCTVCICLAGAPMQATLDGDPVPFWKVIKVKIGQMLSVGRAANLGVRSYLCFEGGLDVPVYLGSRATFALGLFGGHEGRVLERGDVLRLNPEERSGAAPGAELPVPVRPVLMNHWEIGVLYGPHGAPDFFTFDDIESFFSTDWEVHHNSNRTGIRLIGPKPKWARLDGGEAGLHPSNIHDNAYAIGSVDFTGDMPILLGPDGPSLGGFVCPAVVIDAELWKLGQIRPGDKVRFRRLGSEQASHRKAVQNREIETLFPARVPKAIPRAISQTTEDPAVLCVLAAVEDRPKVVYRRSGDEYLLVEYGPPELDLELRFRVHALMLWLGQQKFSWIIDLTPGIRSLQVHFDSRQISLNALLSLLLDAEPDLPPVADMAVPTRIVHLPLSWEDESTLVAIRRYMQAVRPDAPWCPSNIEFIRRINGLDSVDDVRRIVFDASYLVLGLGDVYLGAPVAVPLDPRHRLVTTKYNPARLWTPENAVGIGGAYLCIYGMEGPGGYQFVGRTLQVWNRLRSTADFLKGTPWLLRFFDQICFYPVTGDELLVRREEFLEGKFQLKIETEMFRLRDYKRFLENISNEAEAFKKQQQAAFHAERERWASAESKEPISKAKAA